MICAAVATTVGSETTYGTAVFIAPYVEPHIRLPEYIPILPDAA
jgi:hypothetical protein